MRIARRSASFAFASLASLVLAAGCGGEGTAPAMEGSVDGGSPPTSDDAGARGDVAAPSSDAGPVEATWTMGEPFATGTPPFRAQSHALAPTTLWGSTSGARPTNAAWEDLVLGNGENPFFVHPYHVKARATGLEFGAPNVVTQANAVFGSFNGELAFGARESLAARALQGFDALSATMRWPGSAGGEIVAPLVRGMPYVTVRVAGLTPKVTCTRGLVSVNGASAPSVTGDRFELRFGDGSTWVLYASAPIAFTWNAQGLTASGAFNGVLRAARVFAPSDLAVLDQHRGAYPEGGAVEARIDGTTLETVFAWKKTGNGPLLMATLPHHRDVLVGSAPTPLAVTTLRGPMIAVSADRWVTRQPIVPTSWGAPRPVEASKREAVRAALMADQAAQPAAQDPYFYGKQIAKLGRLALIADELGETSTAAAIRGRMKASLDPWLDGRNGDPLVYDTTWGGVVRRGAVANSGADFGMGYYNDHHFHYGYFLYACAALGKGDAAWLTQKKQPILALARDIANPSTRDTAFTPFRAMDWFEGHSWAGGLFAFADGRNQESTSEAVNAWYGLALLGRALGDANVENVGRVLATLEIQGAQRYWQVRASDSVYRAPFSERKVVGILWGGKVDYGTWFGANAEFVHGIQLLPFTPISEALLARPWVEEQYPVLAAAMTPSASQGWRGFVNLEHAILDKEAAWREVNALTAFDDGNTKTNALYWVATRP